MRLEQDPIPTHLIWDRTQSQKRVCAAIGICGVLDLQATGWEVFTGLVRLGPTVCTWAQFTTGWTRWFTLQLILCWDCHVFAASIGLTGFCNTAGFRVQFAFFQCGFQTGKDVTAFRGSTGDHAERDPGS